MHQERQTCPEPGVDTATLVANSCRNAPAAFPSRGRIASLITGFIAFLHAFSADLSHSCRKFVRSDCCKLGRFQCYIYGGRDNKWPILSQNLSSRQYHGAIAGYCRLSQDNLLLKSPPSWRGFVLSTTQAVSLLKC